MGGQLGSKHTHRNSVALYTQADQTKDVRCARCAGSLQAQYMRLWSGRFYFVASTFDLPPFPPKKGALVISRVIPCREMRISRADFLSAQDRAHATFFGDSFIDFLAINCLKEGVVPCRLCEGFLPNEINSINILNTLK